MSIPTHGRASYNHSHRNHHHTIVMTITIVMIIVIIILIFVIIAIIFDIMWFWKANASCTKGNNAARLEKVWLTSWSPKINHQCHYHHSFAILIGILKPAELSDSRDQLNYFVWMVYCEFLNGQKDSERSELTLEALIRDPTVPNPEKTKIRRVSLTIQQNQQ